MDCTSSARQPKRRAPSMVAYASVYGHTENAAEIFASRLAENGVRDVRLFDVSTVHPSEIVSEAFRCSHLAFFSTTYNMRS